MTIGSIPRKDTARLVSALEWLIRVAEHVLSMRDYQTLVAINSALREAQQYFQQEFAIVSIAARDGFAAVDRVASPRNGYRELRVSMNEQELCMPYVGIALTDLHFIEE